jgi:hypothetical protein
MDKYFEDLEDTIWEYREQNGIGNEEQYILEEEEE